jgi:hypothetical protein
MSIARRAAHQANDLHRGGFCVRNRRSRKPLAGDLTEALLPLHAKQRGARLGAAED